MIHEDYKPWLEAWTAFRKMEKAFNDTYERYLGVVKQRGDEDDDAKALLAAVSAASNEYWQSRGVFIAAACAAERNI
jgi:cation transport regulator ChaB